MMHWVSGSLCDLLGSEHRQLRAISMDKIDAQIAELDDREKEQKMELERELAEMDEKYKEQLKQIDTELADQIEELHREMDARAHDAIARYEEELAEIEEEKNALERQAHYPLRQRSRAVDLGDTQTSPQSTPDVSKSAAFGSSAFESHASQSGGSEATLQGSAFASDRSQSTMCADTASFETALTADGDSDGEEGGIYSEAATDEQTEPREDEEDDDLDEDHDQEDHRSRSVSPEKKSSSEPAGPLSFCAGMWRGTSQETEGTQGDDEDANEDAEEEECTTNENRPTNASSKPRFLGSCCDKP